jgi:hypothetical protein
MTEFATHVKHHPIVVLICVLSIQMSVGALWCQPAIHFALSDGKTLLTSLPQPISLQDNGTVLLKTFRFYIHDIRCKEKGREVWSSSNTHYLFDSEISPTLDILTDAQLLSAVDEISFVIGVDSTLQSSGAQGGALDPIQGMYWTWQSGYIHWKLEGEYAQDTISEVLTWHVGGYRSPNNTLRTCRYTGISGSNQIQFTLDVSRIIREAHANVPASVMSPSAHAMKLADIFQSCLQWQP